MEDLGYPDLGQRYSATETALVVFSAFLLENDDLLATADGFHHGFNIGLSDCWPADEGVTLRADQRHLLEEDLSMERGVLVC